MKAYCLFCKTGSEDTVVEHIKSIDSTIKTIVPVRILLERRMGIWEKSERLLFPGYVFVYLEDHDEGEVLFEGIKTLTRVYKVLEYQKDCVELMGSDYEYASWIYKHDGKIEPSKIRLEGKTVKPVDGPLADNIGEIVKLDRHKRRVWVELDFIDKKHRFSLSVIEINH